MDYATLKNIHAGLANSGLMFMGALAVWALFLRLRSQPLDGNWFGAAVVGELLLIAQFVLGCLLYFQVGGATLGRPQIHILYGIVALIVLPAGYSYFGQLDENIRSLAMAFICIFLVGIIWRASQVAALFGPAV